MRVNRIVPIGKHLPPFQADLPSLFFGRPLGFVFLLIQTGPTMKPRFRLRGANKFQHGFVAGQRFSSPVGADQTEHAMVDRIPFRRSWRIMRHGDDQAEFICQRLQSYLPLPFAMVVCPAAVRLDQQTPFVQVSSLSHLKPPATNSRHGECWRLVRSANDDVTVIVGKIVNSHGDGPADSPRGKVVVQNQSCLCTPTTARVFEVPHPLFLLGVDANHWPAMSYVQLSHSDQIAKLSISVWMTNARSLFATSAQREMLLSQHTSYRMGRNLQTLTAKGLADFPQRTMRPFQAGDRIPGGGILQKFLQGPHDPGRFSSTGLRPAPGCRIRVGQDRLAWDNSLRPLAIVLRSMPLMRSISRIPPRPLCRAKKPARSLRIRSSAAAKSWLIMRCSRATRLRGCCWQLEQRHTWTPFLEFCVTMGAYLHDNDRELASSFYHRKLDC